MSLYKANYRDVAPEDIVEEGAAKVRVRWLVTEKQGAKNFVMRLFEIDPGGHTPHHSHLWEHEVFVRKGKGILVFEDQREDIQEGDVIFVAPEERHQFRNESQGILEIICLIPLRQPRQ